MAIADKDVEKALDNEYDGVDKFDLVQEILQLQAENEPLKQFARQMIKSYCWDLITPDSADMKELASKLGLIKAEVVSEKDIIEGNVSDDFEAGDTIYRFTDIMEES